MLATLPWPLKAFILAFDCFTFLIKRPEVSPTTHEQTGQMFRTMLQVSSLFFLVMITTLSPSVFISVKNREKTNTVLAGVLAQMTHFTYFLFAASENMVSTEHICYILQFCFCYACFCVWDKTRSDPYLFAGNMYVKNSHLLAMFFFPLIFSKALVNGMHMSPYIIPITFSGEVVGMSSILSTGLLEKFIAVL